MVREAPPQAIAPPKNRLRLKGWYKGSNGYIYIWEPEHPNADKRGYVAEHAKVMASILGQPLLPEEEVHHRNGQRSDNRPGNLEL
jgi:HNH endonuclease